MRHLVYPLLRMALAAPAVAAGEPPRPLDFAYAAKIVTQGEGAVYRLKLTPEVYLGQTRADLGDLRVFNAAGQPVPQALILPDPAQERERGESAPELDLPLFPLIPETEQRWPGLRVRIERGEDWRSIALDGASAATGAGAGAAVYILDARQSGQPMDRLVLRWEGQTFLATLDLDASDDLEQWTPVVTGATLADLSHQGQRLVRDEIRIPPTKARYFRIRFDQRARAVTLAGVRARNAAPRPGPTESEMDLETVAGSAPGEYRFLIPRGLALDGLRIRLPEANTLAGARLESRPSETEPWRERLRATLYRLRQDGVELENPELSLGGRPDPLWRLRIDLESGGIGPGLPTLRAIYRPHELRFVARGQGPYTLAWGSAKPMPSTASDIDGILRTTDIAPAPARIERRARGVGVSAVLTPPLPWRTWLLWVVLVGGALLLVWMAARLFRQMNPPS